MAQGVADRHQVRVNLVVGTEETGYQATSFQPSEATVATVTLPPVQAPVQVPQVALNTLAGTGPLQGGRGYVFGGAGDNQTLLAAAMAALPSFPNAYGGRVPPDRRPAAGVAGRR